MSLKRVKRKPPPEGQSDVQVFYTQDCEYIQRIAAKRLGWRITISQAYEAWSEYSETYAAGWMSFGSDLEIENVLRLHFEPVPDAPVTWQPTPELRWTAERNADGLGPEFDSHENEYHRYVLQQKWVDENGNVEWRDVRFA